MKILIAEDDFASRKFMLRFLSKFGECDVTVDGMEAVDAFLMALDCDEGYDLVCLDIMMPELDGIHLCAEEKLSIFTLREGKYRLKNGKSLHFMPLCLAMHRFIPKMVS